MNFCLCTRFVAGSLVAVALCGDVGAAEAQETKSRDNSGRRLAMVVPPIPAAAKPVPAPGRAVPAAQAKPVEMPSQVKEVVQKGTQLAQGVSQNAVKRAGDVVVWVSTMWRGLNDTPQLSPVREYRPPMPPLSSMRPMEAGLGQKLYFTNERRLKTVVGR